jgi:hypothetical protein
MYASMNDFDEKKRSDREAVLMKWIPRISLIIGICAFIFQVTVLYPWHLELSEEFAALAKLVKNSTA